MKPALLDLEVEDGASLDLALYPANDDGQPWVLQGFAVSFKLYLPGNPAEPLEDGQATIELGVSMGLQARDRIRLQLTPAQTQALCAIEPRRAVAYQVDLVDGLGAVHRLMKGVLIRAEGAPA